MSYFTDEVYSHPNKLLKDHLFNVAKNSYEIIKNMNMDDVRLYSNISFFIGITHDFAKCTSFFQDHLLNDVNSSKAYHSFLSSILTYHVVKKYVRDNQIKTKINFPILAYLVVKNHHGNLKNIFDEHKYFKEHMDDVDVQVDNILNRNLTSLKEFYLKYDIDINYFLSNIDNIKLELKKELFKFKKEDMLDNYLYLILFFSVLIDSDKIDASYTEVYPRIDIDENIVDVYKEKRNFNEEGINKIRQQAYVELSNKVNDINMDEKLYSISLPTGSGKTLAALSFSMKLRNRIYKEKKILPRIIYSLPFLSIIDQNEEVIKDVLAIKDIDSQDVFIKHNSMSEIYYRTSENQELKIDNAEILIESWYSEIIITTFYQLLYTLISNKNRSLKKLHNLNNSIVILDEVQSLPPKYWKLINVLFREISKKYNIWFIFMTATQPAIYSKKEMLPLIEDTDYYFKHFDRVEYKFDLEEQLIDEFNEYILEEVLSTDKDIMIVVNTIQNSIDIFKYLSDYVDEDELYYLSTNILPFERKKRISNIKKSDNRKVIVTTQLIEAGVDIDVDIIYRDFAPIDSIVQTAGRCNRNQLKDKGTVNIIKLINEKEKPFNEYIYDSISRETTYQLVKDIDCISEKDFADIIDEYYTKINGAISTKESNEILKKLSEQKISDITKDFSLIEENIQKQDVFIDINDKSHEIWNRYKEIYSSDKSLFDKKRDFKKIKSEFRKYVLSVDIKKIGTIPIEYNMAYVDNVDMKRKYDSQMGFISLDDEDAFII
ncbi:MAG: CRISPR-associated helicase Cas3' [Methanosphaera sp.]|nr:CRISPR-associated helicase Cas3' [Methanosphaera sp.]